MHKSFIVELSSFGLVPQRKYQDKNFVSTKLLREHGSFERERRKLVLVNSLRVALEVSRQIFKPTTVVKTY